MPLYMLIVKVSRQWGCHSFTYSHRVLFYGNSLCCSMFLQVNESSEFLPLVYNPDTISAYWGKRPRAVASRIIQLTSVAGGFLSRLAWDVINKKVKEVRL